MKGNLKFLLIIAAFIPCFADARDVISRAARVTNTPTSGYTYNYMYPYLNNKMRTELNPGDANDQSTSPINAIVRTEAMPNTTPRRVVSRGGDVRSTARSATTVSNNTSARAAYTPTINTNRGGTGRNVVARSTRTNNNNVVNRSATNTSTTTSSVYVSTSRCLADYTECMNSYCVRADTPYNKCFCSSKLSQIQSHYEPIIDTLIKQIITAKNAGDWTDEEMTEYWNEKIGQYVGENTWEKLDDALNIDWPSADERMNGQQAFITGHQYCVNHLKNCAYAAPNLRDVYRSGISRDCSTYEQSLDKLKTALETILETYGN